MKIRLPEPCPDWLHIVTRESMPQIFEMLENPQLQQVLQRANREYIYWDRFKHKYQLQDPSPEIAWACLKWVRRAKRVATPLHDTDGQSFGYWLPDILQRQLHFLDQHASGSLLVDNAEVPPGERERFIISSIMDESIASSQLEGAVATRQQAREMLRTGRLPQTRSEHMIYNNYQTMLLVKKRIAQPLSHELLLELQSELTHDALDYPDAVGRLRREDEQVQVTTPEGLVVHTPPPANVLPQRLQMLCDYANQGDKGEVFTHPVIKAILLHFWLAYDHPFVDGNGRTARALFYWHMLKHGYWLTEYLSISQVMLKAPAQYARAYLYAEHDDADATYFVAFHLRVVRAAVEELRAYLRKKTQDIITIMPSLIRQRGINHRQQQLLYHALTHPTAVYTIRGHQHSWNVTYQTARQDLLRLEHKRLMIRMKRGQEFIFAPVEGLNEKLQQGTRQVRSG